jgi:hypothetical protein
MNNRGQVFVTVIVAIMIFLVGITFLNYFKDDIPIIRNSENLDCSNASGISDGNKLSCLVIGLAIPYLFLVIVSLSGGLIADKFLIGGRK